MRLAGGGAHRAQGQRADVSGAELAGNTGLSGGSAHGAFRQHTESGWGMAVTFVGRVATQVRDEQEMHRLHDILPLRVALNGKTEERDEMEPEKISLSGHLMGYQIFVWWI